MQPRQSTLSSSQHELRFESLIYVNFYNGARVAILGHARSIRGGRTHCHNTVREVERLLYSISVMDVYVNVQYAWKYAEQLHNCEHQIIYVTEPRCSVALAMMQTSCPVDCNVVLPCCQLLCTIYIPFPFCVARACGYSTPRVGKSHTNRGTGIESAKVPQPRKDRTIVIDSKLQPVVLIWQLLINIIAVLFLRVGYEVYELLHASAMWV